MDIQRVALIYDESRRPETTGTYCRRALADFVDVQYFEPALLDEVPRGEFDLYLNVDDGLRYQWPADLRPAACWIIDTHLDFLWSLAKCQAFDFVFAAQRDGAAQLREAGIVTASWLPLACDPEVHRQHEVEKE